MTNYSLVFPEDFEDYAWEVESKGWYAGARLTLSGKHCRLNFYDPVRLSQEVQERVEPGGFFFFEPNLIVVRSVTRENMEKAVERLMESGNSSSLLAE